MDFAQAEQQFQLLEASRQAGTLDEETYRARLNALKVTDERGRVWMLQERTGQWYVWENGTWQVGEPPKPATPAAVTPPPPPIAPAPVHTQTSASTSPPMRAAAGPAVPLPAAAPAVPSRSPGTNRLGFVLPLLLWGLLVAAAIYINLNYGDAPQDAWPYIAGGALVGLVWILWRLTRHYEGIIERVRVEEVVDTDDDGSSTTRRVTYAFVKTASGKVKKIQARKGYAKGDHLLKRKGDWSPRKVKAR